jgi:hypothetical protein
MSIEMILGAIGLLVAVITGAFGFGHSRGTTKAESVADKQRNEEIVAATNAVAERRVEATKGASDVQQTVNHMPDDNVDRELHDNWTRKT